MDNDSYSNSDLSNWEPNYEKRRRRSDYEFEREWMREALAKAAAERKQAFKESIELKVLQEQRSSTLTQQRYERYQKLKELKEAGDTLERNDVEQINKLRRLLYTLKYNGKVRQTIEPIPDKPGYVKMTIIAPADDEIEWDETKLGPRPNPDF